MHKIFNWIYSNLDPDELVEWCDLSTEQLLLILWDHLDTDTQDKITERVSRELDDEEV